MTDMAAGAEAGPSSGPHRMRITSAGNMKGYVAFALDFLKNHPDRPLILHSLPNPPSRPSKSSSDASRTLRPCTLAAPRLITVAEIIKRELILSYEKEGRGKGKHKAIGVWQYTETGLVPAELLDGAGRVEKEEEEVARTGELARILGGKTRPKMTHHPHLQITLSTRPLGLEKKHDPDGNGGHTFVTCQHITIPRRRKHSEKREAVTGDAVMDADIDVGMEGEGSAAGEVELGEVISRPIGQKIAPQRAAVVVTSDIGALVPRPPPAVAASSKSGLKYPARATEDTPKQTPHGAGQAGSSKWPQQEAHFAEASVPIKAALTSDKPQKSITSKDTAEAKEKKKKRLASNAIDAEFAMFGKSTKKKKPSKP